MRRVGARESCKPRSAAPTESSAPKVSAPLHKITSHCTPLLEHITGDNDQGGHLSTSSRWFLRDKTPAAPHDTLSSNSIRTLSTARQLGHQKIGSHANVSFGHHQEPFRHRGWKDQSPSTSLRSNHNDHSMFSFKLIFPFSSSSAQICLPHLLHHPIHWYYLFRTNNPKQV